MHTISLSAGCSAYAQAHQHRNSHRCRVIMFPSSSLHRPPPSIPLTSILGIFSWAALFSVHIPISFSNATAVSLAPTGHRQRAAAQLKFEDFCLSALINFTYHENHCL